MKTTIHVITAGNVFPNDMVKEYNRAVSPYTCTTRESALLTYNAKKEKSGPRELKICKYLSHTLRHSLFSPVKKIRTALKINVVQSNQKTLICDHKCSTT